MKRIFILFLPVFLFLSQFSLNGQSGGTKKLACYMIKEAHYIHNDSSVLLNEWTDMGMHILFAPANDSLIVSIDIGGQDNICFMGMATAIANPGFIASSSTAEFYHWIFVSHIKEGLRNAYIHKEYVDQSFEKLGRRLYFINILFTDNTEFQFYGHEISPDNQNKR